MQPEENSQQSYIEKLLCKDVHRTFSEYGLFLESPKSGKNKLFNLLKAYSLYEPDIGYLQGMNFIAALILRIFNEDEVLAWVVFIRIL